MDIVETASSNASSEDMLLFDESPKRHKHLDGFYPSHDMVQPLPAAPAADPSLTYVVEYACSSTVSVPSLGEPAVMLVLLTGGAH